MAEDTRTPPRMGPEISPVDPVGTTQGPPLGGQFQAIPSEPLAPPLGPEDIEFTEASNEAAFLDAAVDELGAFIEDLRPRQHLDLHENEKQRLVNRVRQDFSDAQQDHTSRITRFARYMRLWRTRVGQAGGDQGKSNFHVPLVKWQLLTKWAKVMEAILGDEAEIVAVPVGPSDGEVVQKVGRYFTWRLFDYMRISNRLVQFVFNYLMYGRAHAYTPYRREEFEVPGEGTQVEYDGPDFQVIPPDDLIVPAEDVESIQDFSYVIYRVKETLDSLLQGEEDGKYQGITENFGRLYNLAGRQRRRDESNTDRVRSEQDLHEGVNYDWGASSKEGIEVWKWYGRWRLPRTPGEDVNFEDWGGRDRRQTDILVSIIPDLNLWVGTQRLADQYPRLAKRRPFVEISLVKDGSYWPPSFPEFLEDMEAELTRNYNNTTEAVEKSIGPLILYKPGSGFNPETFKYEPNLAVPVDDPSNVKVIELPVQVRGAIERDQTTISMAERVTGITDMNIGRASDRPNAPKTARQTVALMEEGNIRITLDTNVLRTDLKDVLRRIWAIDSMFAAEEVFFRVTEEQSKGLFPVEGGGATLTYAERAGQFDFQLKFADSVHSREQRKQEAIAMYEMDLRNPLIMNDPHALWAISNRVHKIVFRDEEFGRLVPEPATQEQMLMAQMLGQVAGEEAAAEELEENGPPPLTLDEQLARDDADTKREAVRAGGKTSGKRAPSSKAKSEKK